MATGDSRDSSWDAQHPAAAGSPSHSLRPSHTLTETFETKEMGGVLGVFAL